MLSCYVPLYVRATVAKTGLDILFVAKTQFLSMFINGLKKKKFRKIFSVFFSPNITVDRPYRRRL